MGLWPWSQLCPLGQGRDSDVPPHHWGATKDHQDTWDGHRPQPIPSQGWCC